MNRFAPIKLIPTSRIALLHDDPIGPHPMGSYQITFTPAHFGNLIPWLAFNRDGLSILVHPDTGDDIPDHTDRAIWLGLKLDLDTGALR